MFRHKILSNNLDCNKVLSLNVKCNYIIFAFASSNLISNLYFILCTEKKYRYKR